MSGLSQSEFELLLVTEKVIEGDIAWQKDQDHAAVEFLVRPETADGFPLVIRGSYNHEAKALSFSVIHRAAGRIYALDLGKEHRNPSSGQLVGELHKHRWSQEFADREAYRPDDITATVDDPVAVWEQFCDEAGIVHRGKLTTPKPARGLFDGQ
jgi:hypothetical protein